MFAFAARHMVATTVFLDSRLAFRAFLCVGGYPIGCFRIIFALLQPLLHKRARSWLVVVQSAAKAKSVVTGTLDRRHYLGKVPLLYPTLYCILAVRSRTPLELVHVINVGAGQEFPIPKGK